MDLLVEGVSHGFGALPVLDRVSLEIASGEIVALLGPSGCGKSTLLGIAGGMVAPDAGRVRLRGEAPAACLNPLTYVFQDFALLPWRDVAGNVALPLEHHGLGAAERARRVDDALARIGLSDFRGAWPRQLSGGMRQRVGIARALVVEPAVLLMDEPLSALDAQTRELLMEDLLALWRQTRFTALYVTHNLAEALRLAHRVVVLSRRPGRVREVVEVPIPVEARGGPAAAATLAALHERLWALLRDEARDAEREIADAGAA
ncbi:MAG: ABC transporter ATP-binding protein [Alphaproteobacteria bacterium]|jgi:NitT/TauT family transport system ATP-binding protein